MKLLKFILFTILISLTINLTGNIYAQGENSGKEKNPLSSSTFSGLKFRNIGTALTSGRISDFAVNPDDPSEYYVGTASSNLWKTTNDGITFTPVFDDQNSYSIGCVAMDPNNHFVVWIGTGENNSQRSVAYGDGVYKSTDGGKNWKNVGLKKSEHIGKILIDPRNSDVVYVAAQGPLWGPGGDRGLYKTTDGGKTWENVLKINEDTGVSDIEFDPRNPDVIYASAYQRRRHVFTLINGGPGSAIYKTTDAGKSWSKLESGLPKVDLGRIGLAVSPVNPDVVYAIVEAADEKGGFFRSENRGATWEKQSDYIARSPQYYMEIYADQNDVDKVYSLDTWTKVTDDGGKTWNNIGNKDRHVDDHALWIDPNNTSHFLIGGDGGVYETYDDGSNWEFKSNLPFTQFYRVTVDNTKPFYYVYGGTQDNNSLGGPSQTINEEGIVNSDWFVTNGGDGFESAVDPEDPNIVYAQAQYGWLVRYDKKSGESIMIKPQERKDEEPYRWNWDSPLIISPHKHTRLYFAANKLFKSEDRGNSWEVISPDLTRQIDRNKLPVMGRVWSVDAVSKNASTSIYGNIVSLTESPLKEGLLYAGTDDGLIQITKDDGANWTKIEKVGNVPEMTYVSCLYASLFDANTVYASFDNHKNADFKPYIYKSTDAGKSWESISSNLPKNGPVYSIVQDEQNKNLLFAGTEFGVFFTIDGGKKWVQLKGGLPTISIRDIDIQRRENDLALASFGRGFYILDNYTPLRSLSEKTLNEDAHLFPVKDALMFIPENASGSLGATHFKADNPPYGATITYYLKESIKTRKEQRQEKEKELIKEGKPVPYPSFEELRKEDDELEPYLLFTIWDDAGNKVRTLKAKPSKGINRITWDLRYPDLSPVNPDSKEDPFKNDNSGMLALPGKYKVTMSKSVDGEITELASPVEFEAKVLNNTVLPAADRAALVDFEKKVSELNRVVSGAIRTAREAQDKIGYIKRALNGAPGNYVDLMKDAVKIEKELNDILRKLNVDRTISSRNAPVPQTVASRVQYIIWGIYRTTSAPTKTQMDNYKIAKEEFSPLKDKLKQIVESELKQLEDNLDKANAPWTSGRM